ncbi:MAG: sulfatase [Bacteroidetes bacterium]|nr:sulfatase [Bacteroidota bacterium]
MRHIFNSAACILILGMAVLLPASGQAPGQEGRPNIIIFFADDLGYGELGCQGNPQIPTPNIDAISANGVRFTDGYVTAPNCSPSRAGLLTGRIPTRFGYEFNPIGEVNEQPGIGLPRDQRTIARSMHDAGYATALIGKWHLGGTADYHPERRGFDEFFGFLHEGHYFAYPWWKGVTTMKRRRTLPDGKQGRWYSDSVIYHTALGYDEPPYDANNPILRGSQPVIEHEYLTDAFTREAISFVDRHRDQPFFLLLSFNAVHSPLQGASAYMEKFEGIEDIQRRIFAAMLANMDDGVGMLMQRLRELELEENTLVVFLSDNGGPTLELTSSNAPLRGGKGSMYEGGVRIPFMMQWKGTIPPGQVYREAVSSMDLLPTCVALAGEKIPGNLDGVNLLPYLTGNLDGRPHEWLFWRQGEKSAYRKGDWKTVYNPRKKQWELFNLKSDLEESADLAGDEPRKLEELLEEWNVLNSQMVKAIF